MRPTVGAVLLLALPALAGEAEACALLPNPASCADDMAAQAQRKVRDAGAGQAAGGALDLVEGAPAAALAQVHEAQDAAERGFYDAWYLLLGELREVGERL